MRSMLSIPLYHQDILAEYDEVLHREKFHLHEESIHTILGAVRQYGMEKRDNGSYLVTGNQKHYPFKDFIVTPAEMIKIIEAAAD